MFVCILHQCHVYMGAIIFSMPFWLMVNKGLLIYAISRFMPCPCLQLWSSLSCHFRALLLPQNVSWRIFYMLFNFAKVVVVDPCML